MYTDASMSGWGAAWNGQVPAAGFFDAAHEGAQINELELLAALYALKHFVRHARRRSVEIVTDSMVTMHVVRNLTSRSPRLPARLRELRALCEREGVTISTRHIPSVLNTWADRLSRRRDSHAWSIPSPAVRLLERRFSPTLSVMDGNELPSYIPRTTRPLVLPRPALLPVWARHLHQLGRVVMLSPQWDGQQWYQGLVRDGVRAQQLPPELHETARWATVAFCFDKFARGGGLTQDIGQHSC